MVTHIQVTHMNGLVKDCGNSSADALELPQSCTKLSICSPYGQAMAYLSSTLEITDDEVWKIS